MSGVLLICVSLMVSAGAAGDLDMDALPFSVEDVIERASPSSIAIGDATFLVERWLAAPSTSLLDEFVLDTSIVYSGAPYREWLPSIAFSGTEYLVVWADKRSLDVDIYGSRVDTTGTVLDPVGIGISTATGSQSHPSVAFDGTNYLVVWDDCRSGSQFGIYGARVNQSGAVLDTSGIAIYTSADSQACPHVAFDGTNYFVAWEDYRGGLYCDIYATRIAPSGTVLDPSGIAIATSDDSDERPSLAFDGTNYLVVWESFGIDFDIFGARVDTSGVVLDSLAIFVCLVPFNQRHASVSFDGVNYFVVWDDYRRVTGSDIYGARVDTSGTVLDLDGVAVCTTSDYSSYPSVAFDGTNYLVVWQLQHGLGHKPDIYGTMVDTSGTVLHPSGIAVCTTDYWQEIPSVAFGSNDYLVVWEDWRSGTNADIYATRVSPSGAILDPLGILISMAGHPQWHASVASDGSDYLAAWEDWRSGTNADIYATRVSPSGAILDPLGILISMAADSQVSPSATFGGANYLVVWADKRGDAMDIYGARLSQSGTLLDTSGIAILTGGKDQVDPSAAFDGTNYFVVWEDHRAAFPESDIYGARVDTSGTVLDPTGIAITSSRQQWSPCVAFGGSNYLVAWEHLGVSTGYDIRAGRVDTSGTILDGMGIVVSALPYHERRPSVAYGGVNYLIVWKDVRGGIDSDIYGARVDAAGTVLDTSGIAISTAVDDQTYPSVTYDGANYLVVWQDYRNGSDWNIYGSRVDASGEVLDPSGIELMDQPYSRVNPAVTTGGDDQVLLVYDGFASLPYNTNRVFGAFYTETGIREHSAKIKTQNAKLFQNQPNPFHSQTTIHYQIPEAGGVFLKVYDSSGRLVSVLADEEKPAGSHTSWWHGKDSSGHGVPSGVYFCRLQTGEFVSTRKMILVR